MLNTIEVKRAVSLLPAIRDVLADDLANGRCVHGVYVGGCGIDWMCGACESGEDYTSAELVAYSQAIAQVRAERRKAADLELASTIRTIATWTEDQTGYFGPIATGAQAATYIARAFENYRKEVGR